MQEEYYCPKCGLQHRLVRHDTPETIVMCIQCGHKFAIKDASQQSAHADAGKSADLQADSNADNLSTSQAVA